MTVVIYPFCTCNVAQENLVRIILILNKLNQKIDIIITYDAVRMLLANPPSLNPCPNFFNIHELSSDFAREVKKIPCPQSPVNGWAGAIMSPEMYVLINANLFHLINAPTTATPAYPIKYNPDGAIVPYMPKRNPPSMQNFPWLRTTLKP